LGQNERHFVQPWIVIGDRADEGGLQAGVFVDGVAEAVDGVAI
jgi:hypothetical protein